MERRARSQGPTGIFDIGVDHPMARGRYLIKQRGLDDGEEIGVLIGFAADHDPIGMGQGIAHRIEGPQAAVEDDFQVRTVLLEAMDKFVLKRRYFTVFLGAESAEDGKGVYTFARMKKAIGLRHAGNFRRLRLDKDFQEAIANLGLIQHKPKKYASGWRLA